MPQGSALANQALNCYGEGMNKQANKKRSRVGQVVTVRADGSRNFKTKFGGVTISGRRPAAEIVTRNVERSSMALERVGKKLTKPGIAIRSKKNVPQYSVAEDEIGVFIRRLNGRVERGRLVKGVFRVID
jgi:hypothetical protein